MIIFLYGQNTYRSKQKLNEIIEHYKKIHKSGLNLTRLNLKENNFEDFKGQIETISMFKEKKLIILENAFSNQDFIEKFLKYKKDFGDNIILFFEEGIINNKNPLFGFLKKNSKHQEFNLLDGEKLKNWAKKEFDSLGGKIDEKALEKLIEFIGDNLWQMSNEIKKLVSYKKKKKIGLEDIQLLVRPKIELDIFKTIDSLASKNKKQALKLIHNHLEKGDNPLYLLSMINFQFRNLLIVKSEKLRPGKLKLHPYIIKKTREQSRMFPFFELKKIYQKIFQIDFNIKTGREDPEVALDLLIAEV